MYYTTTQNTVAYGRKGSATLLDYMLKSDSMESRLPILYGYSSNELTIYGNSISQQNNSTAISLSYEYSNIDLGLITDNTEKLSRISQLGNDWNGYGAMPIDVSIIKKVTELLPALAIQPQLFPTACDTIQFEYEKPNGDYLEFTVGNDMVSAYMMDPQGHEDYYYHVDVNMINKLIRKFYGIHVYGV